MRFYSFPFQYLPVGVFTVLFLTACYEKNANDSRKVKEEMRQRAIVRATPAQIIEQANLMGDSIISRSARLFLQKTSALAPDGSCRGAFAEVQDYMLGKNEVEVNRYSFDPAQLSKIQNGKLKEVIDACFYNKEQKLPIYPNLQKDGDNAFIFSKALVLEKGACTPCHEKMASPVVEGKAGDTIGIWTARYSKRLVVLSLSR